MMKSDPYKVMEIYFILDAALQYFATVKAHQSVKINYKI